MELVVTVLAVVTGVVPMVRVGVEAAGRSGTAGSTVESLGCEVIGSTGVAGELLKSFDSHCGVGPEELLLLKKYYCVFRVQNITFSL